jgi:hypothetical protein
MAITSERPPADARVLQGDAADTVDGTEANERLTAAGGAVLLVLLAALGVTILNLRMLIWEHLFLGMALIGPVVIKLISTGYRFVRYYAGDGVYVRKGPPPIVLRAIGPVVVLSTLVVFASGVVLLFAGPSSRGTFFPIHKLSFIAWLAFMALHVLGHLPSLPKSLRGDYATRKGMPGYLPGRDGRVIALAGALVAGLVVAIVVIPDFGAWTSSHAWLGHHHHG